MNTEQEQPKRSAAEWTTLGIASFILAVIVSLVGYIWLKEKDQPLGKTCSNLPSLCGLVGLIRL
jgi:hypothetical protein